MTLLVAGLKGKVIWMIADAAVTGGNLGVRKREYLAKIVAGPDASLIGFSGDPHHGQRLLREACSLQIGPVVVSFLTESSSAYCIDFCYGFRLHDECILYKISQGVAKPSLNVYLGSKNAFELFQKYRNRQDVEHSPASVHQLLIGAPGDDRPPGDLITATAAMYEVFAGHSENDVGGWVTPFFLGKHHAVMCPYAYSVTDPIVDTLRTGDLIPHGTPSEGGFAVSFAPLEIHCGAAVYWLQLQAGYIYQFSECGYHQEYIEGDVAAFKRRASEVVDQDIHVWFGQETSAAIDKISILRDEQGEIRGTVSQHGQNVSFGWVQGPSNSYRTSAVIDLRRLIAKKSEILPGLSVEMNDGGGSATIKSMSHPDFHMQFTAAQIDGLLVSLAEVRALMWPGVPIQPEKGRSYQGVVNPAWQIWPRLNVLIEGATLFIRHPGFGWLTFIIPSQEAKSIAEWLLKTDAPTK